MSAYVPLREKRIPPLETDGILMFQENTATNVTS